MLFRSPQRDGDQNQDQFIWTMIQHRHIRTLSSVGFLESGTLLSSVGEFPRMREGPSKLSTNTLNFLRVMFSCEMDITRGTVRSCSERSLIHLPSPFQLRPSGERRDELWSRVTSRVWLELLFRQKLRGRKRFQGRFSAFRVP